MAVYGVLEGEESVGVREVVVVVLEVGRVPGVMGMLDVCFEAQTRSATEPSVLLKDRSWKAWAWAAVRVPVVGAVEKRSAWWR